MKWLISNEIMTLLQIMKQNRISRSQKKKCDQIIENVMYKRNDNHDSNRVSFRVQTFERNKDNNECFQWKCSLFIKGYFLCFFCFFFFISGIHNILLELCTCHEFYAVSNRLFHEHSSSIERQTKGKLNIWQWKKKIFTLFPVKQ